jgi:WhiB family redox-sensing transcriptional regulator
MAAEAVSSPRIADAVGVNRNRVDLWKHRYRDEGLDGLDDRDRSGRPPIYGPEDRLTLVKTITSQDSCASNWASDRSDERAESDVSLLDRLVPCLPSVFANRHCKGMNPEFFYPERGQSLTAVRAACRGCPARTECLALAMFNNERFGIFAGLSQRELRMLRRHGEVAMASGVVVWDRDSGEIAAEWDCVKTGSGPPTTVIAYEECAG